MIRMLYDNLYANSDTQELKLQGLSLPKTLFYNFKVPIIFCTDFKVTIRSQDYRQLNVQI